jgi:hypothetical protein
VPCHYSQHGGASSIDCGGKATATTPLFFPK